MKNIYLSFGENCLTDDILKRHCLKSFSTPYSHGRSNIEYILQIEKDNFEKFLDVTYMKHEFLGQKEMLRLSVYNDINNEYDKLHMNGFEFTHNDVMNDNIQRECLERRYKRLLQLDSQSNLFIFYHHRYCKMTNGRMLLDHLNELKKMYLERCSNVTIIMFTQIIVQDISQRKMEHHCIMGIHIYLFYTLNIWGGDDQDIFWARCDDDLIKCMIDDIRKAD